MNDKDAEIATINNDHFLVKQYYSSHNNNSNLIQKRGKGGYWESEIVIDIVRESQKKEYLTIFHKKSPDNYLLHNHPPHMSEYQTSSLKEIHYDFCFIC